LLKNLVRKDKPQDIPVPKIYTHKTIFLTMIDND
jgi:hypothetical protein